MDKFIYAAINKYFNTLSQIGTIREKEKNILFVILAVYDIYQMFCEKITKQDVEYFNKFIECRAKNSCLFSGRIPCFSSIKTDDEIVSIDDNSIVKTVDGKDITSIGRTIQNFTNFEIRNNMESDNYIVGYDVSDNREIAFNINNFGVFWQENLE